MSCLELLQHTPTIGHVKCLAQDLAWNKRQVKGIIFCLALAPSYIYPPPPPLLLDTKPDFSDTVDDNLSLLTNKALDKIIDLSPKFEFPYVQNEECGRGI